MKPGSPCVPKIWHYEVLRPELMKAASLITKKQAERRVLVLENPSLRGTTFITNTLYAGMQIILPGEIAPTHRHTPNALRFAVEGEGRLHGGRRQRTHNDEAGRFYRYAELEIGTIVTILGSGPVVWIDGLDTPFTIVMRRDVREEVLREDSQPLAHR